MAKFSVIAKNDVLKQTNELDNFEIAVEMFRYLTIEMDFPVVQLIHNETGEVLMLRQVDTTITEYVSPVLFADTPTEETVDPDEEYEINEETALKTECQDIIDSLLESTNVPTMIKEQLENIYNQLVVDAYSIERLQNLKKILKNLSEKY